MRVGIASEGTRGDVYPMLAFARMLREAGHTVRLCAPPDFRADVVATGAEFVSLRTAVRPFIEASARALHRGGLRMLREFTRWGDTSIDNQFDVLPDAFSDCDRAFGAGTVIAGRSAAELAGIPFSAVLYTPALLPSAEHTPCVGALQLRRPWANRALWAGSRTMMNGLLRPAVNRHRRALGLAPLGDLLDHLLSAEPVLAVDRALAPAPADSTLAIRQIRCLHPESRGPLPEKLESFLAQGEPPVYIGFGSMPSPDPLATTRRLLEAIEALGCRALVSRGWAGLGEGALPEGVMTIGTVDHSSLFPRTAAVVHHGGAGTTHSAARAGVPQLIVPHVLDQFYFARRVCDLGVGAAAPRVGRLDAEGLVERLCALLDNEWVAERARALGRELAELGPVGSDLDVALGLSPRGCGPGRP